MTWTVTFLDARVEAEMEEQANDIKARFKRVRLLIGEFGLEGLPRKYVDHVQGPMWELRLRGQDGITRALYVIASGKRVVIVRVFAKKTPKPPQREIKLALDRAKEVK